MMNQVEVKVLINPQDQRQVAALNALFLTLSGVEDLNPTQGPSKSLKAEKTKSEKKIEPSQKQEPTEIVEGGPIEEGPKEAEATEEPEIKVEDVRALLATKVEKNRAEIKAKLTVLGAPNVTALDKTYYPEFMDFLNSLK